MFGNYVEHPHYTWCNTNVIQPIKIDNLIGLPLILKRCYMWN